MPLQPDGVIDGFVFGLDEKYPERRTTNPRESVLSPTLATVTILRPASYEFPDRACGGQPLPAGAV